MKFEIKHSLTDESIEFSGRIDALDMVRLNLSPSDRAVLAACDKPGCNASDRLLALELLFRRLEELYGVSSPRQRITRPTCNTGSAGGFKAGA